MKRSIISSILAVGAVSLMALGGCAHNEAARQPTSSPPFESNIGYNPSGGPGQTTEPGVPSGQATESANGYTGSDVVQHGTGWESSHPSTGQGSTSQGSTGQEPQATRSDASASGQGVSMEANGLGASGATAPSTMSERDLCATITHDARMHAEDIQGGVAIILRPRTSGDLSAVQEHARQIDRRMGQGQSSATGNSCDLFAIGQNGATVSVAESTDAVRLLITTSDQSKVQGIRKQARAFVNANATKGSQPGRAQ